MFSAQINKNGRLAIAPDLTPLVLVQVADLPAGAQTFKTIVPIGKPMIAFHRRADQNLMDGVHCYKSTQNGYQTLVFPTDGAKETTTRVYIFSNILVNTPEWGVFFYNDGQVVYHNNCLPLKCTVFDVWDTLGPFTVPHAVTFGVTECWYENYGGGSNDFWGYSRTSAGYMTNQFTGTGDGYYVEGRSRYIENKSNDVIDVYPWNVQYGAYIETAVYDQYYKKALGIS